MKEQMLWSIKKSVCEHNDAVCSPIRIILFDDVIFLCFGTQLRPAVSNQIHKPLNASDAKYRMLRCCSESVCDCFNRILCFKTQLRPAVVFLTYHQLPYSFHSQMSP